MKRTELREATFLILFRVDFYEPDEIKGQIEEFFSDENIFSEADKEYVSDKVLNTASKTEEIDAALNEVSIGWKTNRMTKVDLTILRLAYYEMKYDDSVPVATAINEAVNLAKAYGTENSASFINGILAKFA